MPGNMPGNHLQAFWSCEADTVHIAPLILLVGRCRGPFLGGISNPYAICQKCICYQAMLGHPTCHTYTSKGPDDPQLNFKNSSAADHLPFQCLSAGPHMT